MAVLDLADKAVKCDLACLCHDHDDVAGARCFFVDGELNYRRVPVVRRHDIVFERLGVKAVCLAKSYFHIEIRT